MRFSNSKRRRPSRSQQVSSRPRFGVEPLEDRRMLAAFELSSLLAANGGDGTAGFVAHGPTKGIGWAMSLSGDLNGDGYADLLVSDPDFDPIVNPPKTKPPYRDQIITEGAVFVVFGNEHGIPPEVDLTSLDGTNGFAIYGNPDDIQPSGKPWIGTGGELAAGADLNGDGIDDAVITTANSPRTYILYGNRQWGAIGTPPVIELQRLTPAHGGDGSQGFVINDSVAEAARSVALNGDVNGDGAGDLVFWSASSVKNGAIVVFGRGVDQPFPAEFSLNWIDGSTGIVIHGPPLDSTQALGTAVTIAGDLNGDGVDEIVIGDPWGSPDAQRPGAGRVFVVYGSTSLPSTIELSDILGGNGADGFVINGIRGTRTESGTLISDRAGRSVHGGGDFNGDGISDLAIGAPSARNESGAINVGEGYIVFGRSAEATPFPAVLELYALDGTNGVTVRGLDEEDIFGRSIGLMNFNGDEYADLVVAAPRGDPDGRTNAGEVFVVFGSPDTPVGGLIDLAGIISGDGSAGLVIRGIDASELVGLRLGVGGDFNGDGVDDLALGPSTRNVVSRAHVVFGGADITPPPSFRINDVTRSEGHSGTVTATFTVTRSGDTSGTDTVDFTTIDDTATAGSDYAATSGTLTFLPGVTSLTVSISVQGDTDDEGDEAFLVQLSNASAGATILDDTGVGTITDDDPINPNTLYVYEIRFESKRNGKDWRAIFEIRSDSNADGYGTNSDAVAAGVQLTVTFAGQTYVGVTDASGVFRTTWITNLGSGNHYAEAVDLALAGFVWDPLSSLNREDDSDNDGLPDAILALS